MTNAIITKTTSTLCHQVASQQPTTNTFAVNVDGTRISAHTPNSVDYTGTLEPVGCAATLNASVSQQVADPATGGIVTVLGSAVAVVNFAGNSLSGRESLALSATAPEAGLPCEIDWNISGTRQ